MKRSDRIKDFIAEAIIHTGLFLLFLGLLPALLPIIVWEWAETRVKKKPKA